MEYGVEAIICFYTLKGVVLSSDLETIFALSTVLGKSGVAVIRISGSNSFSILQKITHKDDYIPRKATLTSFYDQDNQIIDKGLSIFFSHPSSFTGEDCVEFHIHGSRAIIRKFLTTLQEMD